MGFTLSYKTLFEVRLLHHFFLDRASELFDNMDLSGKTRSLKGYDVREFISIEPTAACARVLSKYHFIYKNTPLGLIIGTRANLNAGKYFPALELDDTLQFTFKVSFSDIFFSNYTAVPLLQTKDAVYFFQNFTTASPKKFPYLSQFAPIDTGDTYSAGEILGDAATNAETERRDPAMLDRRRMKRGRKTTTASTSPDGRGSARRGERTGWRARRDSNSRPPA